MTLLMDLIGVGLIGECVARRHNHYFPYDFPVQVTSESRRAVPSASSMMVHGRKLSGCGHTTVDGTRPGRKVAQD